MEYDLFGGSDYLFDGYRSQQGGGSNRYQSGWKKDIPKKPGYKLVKVNGEPKYIKKKARFLLGYNVFVSEWSKKNPKVEGPQLMKRAAAAWGKLTKAEKDKYNEKARRMGKQTRSGPVTKSVAKAHMTKLGRKTRSRKSSKSRSRKSSKSRRSGKRSSKSRARKSSKSRSRKRSSKSRARKSSKSRSRSRSKSRSRARGAGYREDGGDEEEAYERFRMFGAGAYREDDEEEGDYDEGYERARMFGAGYREEDEEGDEYGFFY